MRRSWVGLGALAFWATLGWTAGAAADNQTDTLSPILSSAGVASYPYSAVMILFLGAAQIPYSVPEVSARHSLLGSKILPCASLSLDAVAD